MQFFRPHQAADWREYDDNSVCSTSGLGRGWQVEALTKIFKAVSVVSSMYLRRTGRAF